MFGKMIDYARKDNIITIQMEHQEVFVEIIDEKDIHFYSNIMKKRQYPREINCKVEITKTTNCLLIETESLHINVFDDFKIDIYDSEGKAICRDYRGRRTPKATASKESIELLKQEGHEIAAAKEHYAIEIVKEMDEVDAVYGMGDSAGFLNKKGYAYELWNTDNPMPHVESFKRLYKCIPFMIAKRKKDVYGIFMDNSYHSYWDFGKENQEYYYFATDGGEIDYFFFWGDTIQSIVESYTAVTGTVPLPQLWTLGYHQSRFGYESKEDILEVAQKMRAYQIPCDTIHFDIDYMDHFKVFTFNKQNYGEPRELMKQLKQKGFKPIVILDPGVKVEEGYTVYEEGVAGGYFATNPDGTIYENVVWPGKAVYPDFGKKATRDWWGKKQQYYIDMGVRGIWNDMNEPAGFEGEIPDDTVFYDEDQKSDHAKIHNLYGHLMCKAVHDGWEKYDKRRPFLITRACYAGSQQYTSAWTGDNHSIWSHLQMAIPQLCNLGMSGMGFVGTDIGGFGSDTTPELLCRWVEMGCFSPLCRNHSSKGFLYQEPWQFDEETLRIYRKYIALRYQLLPYLYDCFYQMSQRGTPVFRPLVYQYGDDENTLEINDEFMIGDSILVAPVVTQGSRQRLIYLPTGQWVDYETGERIEGGQYIIKEAPIDVCPIYIDADSMIPMYPIQQYVGEKVIDELTLHVYHKPARYHHYQDDGESFDYQKGTYNLYDFNVDEAGECKVSMIHDGYAQRYRKITFMFDDEEGAEGKVVNLMYQNQEYVQV